MFISIFVFLNDWKKFINLIPPLIKIIKEGIMVILKIGQIINFVINKATGSTIIAKAKAGKLSGINSIN
jgi:hypothetical protein